MSDERQSRIGTAVINNKDYVLFEEIGRGATSVCYRSVCEGKRYVVKEFYPISVAVRDSNGKIVPSQEENAETVFKAKKKSFAQSAKFHREKLHDIQRNDFLSVVEIDEENGFIVMNDTDGQTLSDWAKKQPMNDDYIRKCVNIVKGIIDEAEKYHQNEYVHLDLKAENIYKFNIENNQVLTRIFDFDSIQKIDELYESIQNGTAHIHTTNECYGNEIGDINRQKANYITKEMLVKLDYYAIAKILYYLIYGCYEKTIIDDDSPFEEIYDDCTVLNNYLHNLFDKLCGNIEERDYSAEEMKGFLDKIIFIIDNQNVWKMYSEECLSKNFKSHLMSDIVVEDKVYTMQKGISAIEQIVSECKEGLFLHGYDGGRGKTTALKWLMFRMTGSINELCLYVPLNELIVASVEEQILRKYHLKYLPGNCILLLDGYNEVENVRIKSEVDEFLKENISNKKYRLIVSGRNVDAMFNSLTCCTLKGIKNTKKEFSYLSEELRSNPMIVNLYSGISMDNLSDEIKDNLIGKQIKGSIKISTKGEALWNYFQIQIAEKSNGDMRASDEFKKYIFEQLPYIVNQKRYPGIEMLMRIIVGSGIAVKTEEKTNGIFNENDNKIFERCNKLFNLCEIKHDNMGIYCVFAHQDYEDFFEAICILRELEDFIKNKRKDIPEILPIAADIIGVQYCEPKVINGNIIVPAGYAKSYFGNGKVVIESKEVIKNHLIALDILECMRNNFDIHYLDVGRIIQVLPKKYMNFGNINIGEMFFCDSRHSGYLIENINGERVMAEQFFYNQGWNSQFENVCFDTSFLLLQEDVDILFKNCSFNNLHEGSKVPYLLKKRLEYEVIRIGNCIYSRDKKELLDYIGPESGKDEIILFEETQRIDETFRKHCKNPDAVIRNFSPCFEMNSGVLYKQYKDNDGNDILSVEFCERNITDDFDFEPQTAIIRSFALAYCKNIKSMKVMVSDNVLVTCNFPFRKTIEICELLEYVTDEDKEKISHMRK